jgi:transposase
VEHFAGIDVSLEQSSVCVVDAAGKIVREAKVASEPEALVRFFRELGVAVSRIGLEAGPLSQWLHAGLAEAGFEVVLLETRHVKAALSAMVVKTDRKDARGIAQLLRMGWFRPVHAKSPATQEIRALLVARKLLQAKLLDVELSIRGILRGFGLKMGEISKAQFVARVRELVAGHRMLDRIIGPMLRAREALRTEYCRLHREMLGIVKGGRRRVPASDDGVGRGGIGGDHLQISGRRSRAVRQVESRGRAFRPDAKEVSVGRDRRDRRDQPGRRCDGARRALRGGPYHAEPHGSLLQSEALGHGCRQAPRPEARQGRPGPQAGDRSASHVAGWSRLPLGQGGRHGRVTRRDDFGAEARTRRSPQGPAAGTRDPVKPQIREWPPTRQDHVSLDWLAGFHLMA